MVNKELRKKILIDSIGCNQPDLIAFLHANYKFAEMGSFGCSGTVRHLTVKLALIENAQMFTRDRIDTADSQSNSKSESKSSGSGYSDSQAQRSRRSRNCGYAVSKSFQRSVSDSESTMRSTGDANEYEEEHEYELTTDRSIQRSEGYNTSYSYSDSQSVSDSTGLSVSHAESMSIGHSRTGSPNNPAFEVDSSQLGLPTFMFTPPFISDPNVSDGVDDVGPSSSACVDCGDLSGVNFTDVYETLPNLSRSYNVNYSVDFTLPVGGGASKVTWTWSNGADFSQSHTIVTGRATSGGSAINSSESSSTSESNSEGGNVGHSENLSQSDIHGMRDRLRERLQTNKAISVSQSGSEAKARGESESESHSETRGSGQGTSQGRSHSESLSNSTGTNTSKSESKLWSQIFSSLTTMFNDTYKQIQDLQRSASINTQPIIAINQGNRCLKKPTVYL